MADGPSPPTDTDLEKNESPQYEHDSDEGDDSDAYSESHMEGARSIRTPSRGGNSNYNNNNNSESLSRTPSRLERTETAASTALATIRSRVPRAPFKHPLDRKKTAPDVIVDFDGPDDPYRPLNWPTRKKVISTALYGFTTMSNTMSSAIYSPAVDSIAQEFGVGKEVSILGISLFLFGFGLGPLLWAPLSEVYGRKIAVLPPVFVAAMFAFGAGAAENIQTLLICRFFQGFWGSAPVTNSGGVLGDIFTPAKRGAAMVGYSMAIVGGPSLGPIIGGAFVIRPYLGWRWTQYLTGIFQCFVLVLDVLILDESYAPVLLVRKAQQLRHTSGNWALHARHEEWNVSLKELANKYLIRPFVLLSTPICFLMALYASFTYGILYASLAAFPIEFEETRGWNVVVGSLPFLAQLIGVAIGAAGNIFNQKFYVAKLKANNGRPVPEARLPPMMVGGFIFAGGLFIFAWTSPKDVPWIAPCIGIALQGIGFLMIFQGALNYLIDTFQRYAASAVAANSFLRSVFAGVFPLFINPMLSALGIGWGISVFAFFATVLIPVPFVFYVYGFRIRARGAWSKESTL